MNLGSVAELLNASGVAATSPSRLSLNFATSLLAPAKTEARNKPLNAAHNTANTLFIFFIGFCSFRYVSFEVICFRRVFFEPVLSAKAEIALMRGHDIAFLIACGAVKLYRSC